MQPIRRLLLKFLAGMPLAHWLPAAHAKPKLVPTPAQPEGPFYPREFPPESDSDLFHYAGTTAKGTLLELSGRVLQSDGSPVSDAIVEIWQCDAEGEYLYDAASMRAASSGFQGFGKTVTDNDGRYRFLTIRPVPYPGRPPHIHMRVKRGNKDLLITQMYIKGDGAERDPFVARLPDAARKRLFAELNTTPKGLSTNFDIVIAA